MSIEVEAADMLVYPGEGAELLDGTLSCFQHLALQALGLPRNIFYAGCLLYIRTDLAIGCDMYFLGLPEEMFACRFHLLLYSVHQENQKQQSAAPHRHS